MGMTDFIKEGFQEIDEDSDPALARGRAAEHARQLREQQEKDAVAEAADETQPITPETPGPSR
jgi:hypothetical protein